MSRPVDPRAAPGWTPDRIAEASILELRRGRLPLRAQWRLAEQRARAERGEPGAFTSDLTVEEFAAIRSVGFRPVGQVLGTAVVTITAPTQGCGALRYAAGPLPPVVPLREREQILAEARRLTVSRMRHECAELGGDGVVGVRIAVRLFHDIGLEFLAVGTAVRADGEVRPKRPFTSDLSGQDFAKLLRAGWVPVALVQGVSVHVRHDDVMSRMQGASWTNQELIGPTELVVEARAAARTTLAAQARKAGADTVVLRDMSLYVYETRCLSGYEAEDRVAEAVVWGTAITAFTSTRERPADVPLSMLRLNPGKGER